MSNSLSFKAPLIRAILAGQKRQTRRLVKVQPPPEAAAAMMTLAPGSKVHGNCWWKDSDALDLNIVGNPFRCPYGVPGNLLWVREAFRFPASLDGLSPSKIAERVIEAGYSVPWCPTQYEADGRRTGEWATFEPPMCNPATPGKYRPPMFMPRWASRISLSITAIRIERLNDISEEDALAEGITGERVIIGANCYGGAHCEEMGDRYFYDGCQDEGFESAAEAFADLWESINGPGSWAANPWVFVIEFGRVSP